MHRYRAKVIRVIDGDTLEASIDLGFGVSTRQTLRLYGIDAPELSIPEEKARAELAKQFLQREIDMASGNVEIQTFPDVRQSDKADSFKRYLAIVYAQNVDLNLAMVQNGTASAYTFRKTV